MNQPGLVEAGDAMSQVLFKSFEITLCDAVQTSLFLTNLPHLRGPRRRRKLAYIVISPIVGAIVILGGGFLGNHPIDWPFVKSHVTFFVVGYCLASLLIAFLYAIETVTRPWQTTRRIRRERKKTAGINPKDSHLTYTVTYTVRSEGLLREYDGGSDLTHWHVLDALEETPELLIARKGNYGTIMPKRDLSDQELISWRSEIRSRLQTAKRRAGEST